MAFSKTFTLAGLSIRLDASGLAQMTVTENFTPFLSQSAVHDATVRLTQVSTLPQLRSAELLFSDYRSAVFQGEGGFFRVFHDRREQDRPYAVSQLNGMGNGEELRYLEGCGHFFGETQSCFAHISLEALLLHAHALILHGALVASRFGGLLFCGPSGIGKSTQAALWVRHEKARLINGDRTIVRKQDGLWTAYGSPYAGSSGCYVNEGCPVRLIALLSQGQRSALERLSPAAAFRGLYAGTTVNYWNPAFVEQVCALLAALISAVPVYRLTCTPDRAAVEALRSALEAEYR